MTGRASAELICKAKVVRPEDPECDDYTPTEGYCGNVARPDLRKVGEFIQFFEPEGWHVEIGSTPEETIVRCPEHCAYVEYKEFRQGHWQDAP